MPPPSDDTHAAELVWMRSPPTRGRPPAHTREEVTAAAIAIADAEGLDAVSMRRVAGAIGAGTASLYRYVSSKEQLIELMLDAALGSDDPPGLPSGDWRADLVALAGHQRRLGLRHPWWVVAPARPGLGPNALRRFDLALAALERLPVDMTAKGWLITTIDRFVRGFVEEELIEHEQRRRTGMTDQQYERALTPYIRAVLASGAYPHLHEFIADNEDVDPDHDFQVGLTCLLDGLEAFLTQVGSVTGAGPDTRGVAGT